MDTRVECADRRLDTRFERADRRNNTKIKGADRQTDTNVKCIDQRMMWLSTCIAKDEMTRGRRNLFLFFNVVMCTAIALVINMAAAGIACKAASSITAFDAVFWACLISAWDGVAFGWFGGIFHLMRYY